MGYAYILTHPGIPCLFWPHAVRMPDGRHGDMAAEVAAMVRMRKDAGIAADSRVDILVAESDVYVARVKGRHADVTVKLGPRYDFPAEIMPAEGGGSGRCARAVRTTQSGRGRTRRGHDATFGTTSKWTTMRFEKNSITNRDP